MSTDYKQGDVLKGQEYIPELDLVVKYTAQRITQGEQDGVERSQIDPENTKLSLKKTWAVPVEALAAFKRVMPVMISDLQIPDVLTDLGIIWSEQSGNGVSGSGWSGSASGDSWQLSGQGSYGSSGSAAVVGEVYRVRKQYWTRNLPGVGISLYLPESTTTAQIIALLDAAPFSLTGIQLWPVFKPEAITLVIHDGKVSVRSEATFGASQSYRAGDPENDIPDDVTNESTSGGSKSVDYAPSVSVVEIPPTLHGGFTLADSNEKSAESSATLDAITSEDFPHVELPENAGVAKVKGTITPKTIAATAQTTVPVTGQYITDIKCQPFRWNYMTVYIEVLDATVLA